MVLRELDPILRRLIIQAVRMWFPRTQKYKSVKDAAKKYTKVLKNDGSVSKRKSVSYKCNICKNYFKSNEVEVDHIREVIDGVSSSLDLTLSQYIKRVDCSPENLQVVCKKCHKTKSTEYNKSRVKRDRKGNVLSGKKTRKKSKSHLLKP